MANFAVVADATGEVLRAGQCSDGDVDLQGEAGATVIALASPLDRTKTWRWDGHDFVEIAAATTN